MSGTCGRRYRISPWTDLSRSYLGFVNAIAELTIGVIAQGKYQTA
jgi:hypothetical protein